MNNKDWTLQRPTQMERNEFSYGVKRLEKVLNKQQTNHLQYSVFIK